MKKINFNLITPRELRPKNINILGSWEEEKKTSLSKIETLETQQLLMKIKISVSAKLLMFSIKIH